MKMQGFKTGTALAAAAVLLMFGAPASALDIGDLFSWLNANGGDGSHKTAVDAAATQEIVIETSFLSDEMPPGPEKDDGGPDLGQYGETYDVDGHGGTSGGAAPVPEPTAALLFGAGAFVIAQRMRRRR